MTLSTVYCDPSTTEHFSIFSSLFWFYNFVFNNRRQKTLVTSWWTYWNTEQRKSQILSFRSWWRPEIAKREYWIFIHPWPKTQPQKNDNAALYKLDRLIDYLLTIPPHQLYKVVICQYCIYCSGDVKWPNFIYDCLQYF